MHGDTGGCGVKMLSNIYKRAAIIMCDCRANLNGDHCWYAFTGMVFVEINFTHRPSLGTYLSMRSTLLHVQQEIFVAVSFGLGEVMATSIRRDLCCTNYHCP